MLPGGDWHVVVIGDWPAERVHTRIMEALHGGTMTIIPYVVLLLLHARRLESSQTGEWSEGRHKVVLKHKQKRKFKHK